MEICKHEIGVKHCDNPRTLSLLGQACFVPTLKICEFLPALEHPSLASTIFLQATRLQSLQGTLHISQPSQNFAMAREGRTRKAENKVVVIEPAPQRRSSRLSDGAAPKSYRYVSNKQAPSSSIQRPAREPPVAKGASKDHKTKQKVSITGVFKKAQKIKTGRVSKKVQKRREVTPELDLIGDLQGVSQPFPETGTIHADVSFQMVSTKLACTSPPMPKPRSPPSTTI